MLTPRESPQVRRADRGDEHELMDMCRALWRENGLFSFSERKVQLFLNRAFDRQGAIIGVIGAPGRLEGSIYLTISDYWYSDDWHLCELWNYVLPQYRRSNNAKELITFAKRCADETRLKALIGIISNTKTEAKVKLYQRQLGTAAGAFFVYAGWQPDPPAPVAVSEARQAAE